MKKMETKNWKDIKGIAYGKQGTERRDELERETDKLRDKVMFPEKLAKANKMLETAKIPVFKRPS
jgi:hypothetical protein